VKTNKELDEREVIIPELIVQVLAYDDLTGGSSRKFGSALMNKVKELEKKKLWDFSVEK